MKTDIIYSNDVLLVNLEGSMIQSDYEKLKKKVNYIINEYQINDIVVDIKNVVVDNNCLKDLNASFDNLTIKR